MAVSPWHILHQGPVIAGLGRTAFAAVQQRIHGTPVAQPALPGPELEAVFPPRPRDLVRDYVRHVGGDPRTYRREVPPHLFPQWGFALASRTLEGIPYPLVRVMNGGCRLVVNAPLSSEEPLHVKARLMSIDDNGRRAVLHQRIVTGTANEPEAQVAHLYAIVPLAKSGGTKAGPKKERPRVPDSAREVAFWKLGPGAGLDFAKLTGDFNPIHWVSAWARMSGFKNTILHGFATMARAMEGVRRRVLMDQARVRVLDVKFTRPLVLPARVGLYVDDVGGVWVGDAPGGPAYMAGTYSTSNDADAGSAKRGTDR